MSVDYKVIGKRIKKSRKKVNITQEKLAELMDVSVGYISQIERGVTKPNLTTIDNICTHIGCDLVYIIAGISKGEDGYSKNDLYQEFLELSDQNKSIAIELIEIISKYK